MVAASVPYECERGETVDALQLKCRQHLGDYGGYSGSPVEKQFEQHAELIGLLVEQYFDRESPNRAANVLFAATIRGALQRFRTFDVSHLAAVLGISVPVPEGEVLGRAHLYTAALLDRLGMPEEADRVARTVAELSDGADAALAGNWRAVLAAGRGRLTEADEILRDVAAGTPLGLVNLVAVRLNAGDFEGARELIHRIRNDGIGTDDPRSDVLLAILEIQLERAGASPASLADAVGQLRSIVGGALNDPDLAGLDEVRLLAHLALAEFDLAKARGTQRDMVGAADTATLMTQVLTATFGLEHRAAIVLRTRAAVSDFEVACESGRPDTAAAAIATLRECHHFICTAFGEQDRRAVTLTANIATARLEYARMVRSVAAAQEAFEALSEANVQVGRLLGPAHPTAVTVATNLASAASDLARITDSESQAREAADLLEAAADRSRSCSVPATRR